MASEIWLRGLGTPFMGIFKGFQPPSIRSVVPLVVFQCVLENMCLYSSIRIHYLIFKIKCRFIKIIGVQVTSTPLQYEKQLLKTMSLDIKDLMHIKEPDNWGLMCGFSSSLCCNWGDLDPEKTWIRFNYWDHCILDDVMFGLDTDKAWLL